MCRCCSDDHRPWDACSSHDKVVRHQDPWEVERLSNGKDSTKDIRTDEMCQTLSHSYPSIMDTLNWMPNMKETILSELD